MELTPSPAAPASSLRNETFAAVRNALKLGGSLIATWGVAIAIRLLLPRHLGPEQFGLFNFADAFTTTAFALLTFGVDTHLRKELARAPGDAEGFFGGLLLLRAALAVLLTGGLIAALWALGRPAEVLETVAVFGLAQLLILNSQTLSAALHARGAVDGLSITNVASKVLWGAGIGVALLWGGRLVAIAAALAFSELVKSAVLFLLARRHAGISLALRWRTTWRMLRESLPLYLSAVAKGLYARLDVTLLAFFAASSEVGFYGAASNLAGLTLMLTPLLGWVLLPLLARAARDPVQLGRAARGALELVLVGAIPIALVVGVGADVWTRGLFGEAFAPAAGALRFLAPMFVLTYVAMVCASVLIVQERAWRVTAITVASVAMNAALNVTLVNLAGPRLGAGGPGAAAALALLITEGCVAAALLWSARSFFVDRALAGRALKLAGAAVATVLLDRELTGLGPARLAVDFCFYALAVTLTGALRTREIAAFARGALRRGPPPNPVCAPSDSVPSSAAPPPPASSS